MYDKTHEEMDEEIGGAAVWSSAHPMC